MGNRLGENVRNGGILLVNGDTYFDIDLKSIMNFDKTKNSIATIALRVTNDSSRYRTVLMNGDYGITEFAEKRDSKDPGFMNGEIYILSKMVLDMIPEGMPCSMEKDIFPKLAKNASTFGCYG